MRPQPLQIIGYFENKKPQSVQVRQGPWQGQSLAAKRSEEKGTRLTKFCQQPHMPQLNGLRFIPFSNVFFSDPAVRLPNLTFQTYARFIFRASFF
jgi:hypothetical protein